MKEADRKLMIQSARTIQQLCKAKGESCEGCPFYDLRHNEFFCRVEWPDEWPLPEEAGK